MIFEHAFQLCAETAIDSSKEFMAGFIDCLMETEQVSKKEAGIALYSLLRFAINNRTNKLNYTPD